MSKQTTGHEAFPDAAGLEPAGPTAFHPTRVLEWFDGDLPAVQELAAMLAATLPAHVGALCSAAEAADTAGTARVAHTIRGSAGALAAAAICDQTRLIELAAHDGRTGELVPMAARLQADAGILLAEVQAWAVGLGGGATS